MKVIPTTKLGRAEKLAPQMQAVVESHTALGPKPIPELSPEQARQQPTLGEAIEKILIQAGKSAEPEVVGSVANLNIPVAGGLPAIVYTPEGMGPFPILVYFHGGGWVIATPETYDSSARALTNAAQAVVVSAHYRQAPENKFPAAAEDAYAAMQWVMANTQALNGRVNAIAIGGESAGANLATVACLMARDNGTQLPLHQLLVYPVADHRFDTPSYHENAEGPILTQPMMHWFWDHYLANNKDGDNPYASPLRAEVWGLPPATVITAGFDVLRDEGAAYAARLSQAGIPVDYVNYEDTAHEFFGMGAVLPAAKEAVERAGENLKAAFHRY